MRLNDAPPEIFIRICGEQVRHPCEILLDLDSTGDPTHGQQQLSFFSGAYGQHMYQPMLVFDLNPPTIRWPPGSTRHSSGKSSNGTVGWQVCSSPRGLEVHRIQLLGEGHPFRSS